MTDKTDDTSLTLFRKSFSGQPFQTYDIAPADDDGKCKPINHSRLGSDAPSDEDYAAHLEGRRALAVKPDLWGCIDYDDVEDGKAWITDNEADVRTLGLTPALSKSGNVRLYFCMMERVSRDRIQAHAKHCAHALGIPDAETFPHGDCSVMLPYFGEKCGMVNGEPLSYFLTRLKDKALVEDDLKDAPTEGAKVLPIGRHNQAIHIGSSLAAAGAHSAAEIEAMVTGNFWFNTKSGSDANKDRAELGRILKNIKKKIEGDDFSDLVMVVAENAVISKPSFRVRYKGRKIVIEDAKMLDCAAAVKRAIMTQLNTFPENLTPRRWSRQLAELFPAKTEILPLGDTVEGKVYFIIWRALRESFIGPAHILCDDATRLGSGEVGGWYDKENGLVWYACKYMEPEINTSPFEVRVNATQLWKLVESFGGVAKNIWVPGKGQTWCHGLPPSAEDLEVLEEAVASGESPTFHRERLDKKTRSGDEDWTDEYAAARLTLVKSDLKNSRKY